MGIQGGTSCAAVFLIGQQFLQFLVLLGPFRLLITKGIGQATPAHILGKYHLFSLSSIAALGFQLLHQANGFHIGFVSGLFTIGQIQTVTNHKVTSLGLLGRLLGNLLCNFLMELFSLFGRDICVLSSFGTDICVGHRFGYSVRSS